MEVADHPPAIARGAKLTPLSVEAYHFLGEAGLIPEKTELLYGFVYTKMPKSPLHEFFLDEIYELLRRSLPPGKVLRRESPLTLSDSEPEPDLAVVLGSRDDFKTRHPSTAELVVEICVTSEEYDRLKLRAYASAGVQECWLILVNDGSVEVLANGAASGFQRRAVLRAGQQLMTNALPDLSVDLLELFAKK